MSVTPYDFSVPVLVRYLTNLSAILDKAAAYCTAKKVEPAVLADTRLFPDMLPLKKQVQIACDVAKGAAARLSGAENPQHPDNENNIEELKARIAKTIAFIKSVDAAKVSASENSPIEVKFPSQTLKFTGKSYLTDFVLPNVFFHITTAYALLRHNGVEIGKRDFLGGV